MIVYCRGIMDLNSNLWVISAPHWGTAGEEKRHKGLNSLIQRASFSQPSLWSGTQACPFVPPQQGGWRMLVAPLLLPAFVPCAPAASPCYSDRICCCGSGAEEDYLLHFRRNCVSPLEPLRKWPLCTSALAPSMAASMPATHPVLL